MAYTAPTASDLKARFADFAAVADATIDLALTDAARQVDETWMEEDFAMGRMLFAAHLMTLNGFGAGAQVAGFQAAGVQSLSSGQLSVTFANGGAGASASSLSATSYGNRFRELRRQNTGGSILVA